MRLQPDQIIRDLEANSSRLAKEEIIKNAINSDIPEFFHGLRLALDPLVTFGIRAVPEVGDRDFNPQGLLWETFLTLTEKLASRELTGNQAIQAVQLACDFATQSQWNDWYRRILIKDLKCGLSHKTVNKVCKQLKKPEHMVPVFACQLASDSKNHPKKMVGMKQIQTKLDGVRCLAIIEKEKIQLFSRNGKQFHNFGHIEQQLQQATQHHPINSPLVLDGEIMSSSFQDLMKQVYRKYNVQADDSVFHLFDIIDLEAFERGIDHTPQELRSQKLMSWYETRKEYIPNIRCLLWENVSLDGQQGIDRLEFLKQQAYRMGYEGLLIKDPTAPYQNKRTTDWLKVKPVLTLDMEVTGTVIGTGKNSDRLGALIVQAIVDGKQVISNVGYGFSDQMRIDIWENRDNMVGHIVEVSADAITKNQDGTYSLRFPRFARYRGFDVGEKL